MFHWNLMEHNPVLYWNGQGLPSIHVDVFIWTAQLINHMYENRNCTVYICMYSQMVASASYWDEQGLPQRTRKAMWEC